MHVREHPRPRGATTPQPTLGVSSWLWTVWRRLTGREDDRPQEAVSAAGDHRQVSLPGVRIHLAERPRLPPERRAITLGVVLSGREVVLYFN